MAAVHTDQLCPVGRCTLSASVPIGPIMPFKSSAEVKRGAEYPQSTACIHHGFIVLGAWLGYWVVFKAKPCQMMRNQAYHCNCVLPEDGYWTSTAIPW